MLSLTQVKAIQYPDVRTVFLCIDAELCAGRLSLRMCTMQPATLSSHSPTRINEYVCRVRPDLVCPHGITADLCRPMSGGCGLLHATYAGSSWEGNARPFNHLLCDFFVPIAAIVLAYLSACAAAKCLARLDSDPQEFDV